MIERRATLLVDKKFEGGFNLKRGTPIFVEEWKSGWSGHFYPDPEKHSSHSFALAEDDFSLWVRADTDEPYLVITEEDPPDPKEERRIHEIQLHQAKKAVELASKRLAELQKELKELESVYDDSDKLSTRNYGGTRR